MVWQDAEDALSGRAEHGPAAAGGVGQGHGQSEAPQHGAAQRRALSSHGVLEELQAQNPHVHLQLVLGHVLHPQRKVLVQVSPRATLQERRTVRCVSPWIRQDDRDDETLENNVFFPLVLLIISLLVID